MVQVPTRIGVTTAPLIVQTDVVRLVKATARVELAVPETLFVAPAATSAGAAPKTIFWSPLAIVKLLTGACVVPFALVASICALKLPAAFGVPDTRPVDAFNPRIVGNAPDAIA